MVLGVNALIAFLLFLATIGLAAMIVTLEGKRRRAVQPAE
jgi:hypothetical protein